MTRYVTRRSARAALAANRRRNRTGVAPSCEVCERRLLPAVTAVQAGDKLFIFGDESDNRIEVAGVEPSVVEVDLDGDGVAEQFAGVSDVEILARGGHDVITVKGVELGGDLVISGDEGDDTIRVCEDVVIHGNVRLFGGPGNDTIEVCKNVDIKGGLSIDGGDGEDDVSLHGDVRIGKGLTIKTGAGNDEIGVEETRSKTAQVDLGKGDDRFNLGNRFGNDPPAFFTEFGDKFRFKLGSGDDRGNFSRFRLTDPIERARLRILGMDGDDHFGIGSSVEQKMRNLIEKRLASIEKVVFFNDD
jgi:hypothetical protein